MITLCRTDGTTITLAGLTPEHARAIAPALGKGWAFCQRMTREVDEPIEEAPKAPPKPRAIKEPVAAVVQSVREAFGPGVAMSKILARQAVHAHAPDLVDTAIDWLASKGELVRERKTYRASPAQNDRRPQ